MVSDFLFRFCNRNHVVFTALIAVLALQPTGARADQCDDAWAAYQRGSPETRAATARSAQVDLFGDVDEQRKSRCESENAMADLSRLILNGARKVEQACGGRRKLACDVACQEKDLSEMERKTADECSPAALDAARKADQNEKNQQDADRKVQNACINVVATGTFPDLPHDSDYKNNVKLCNANAKACKYVRETLNDAKWPSDLTCSGR